MSDLNRNLSSVQFSSPLISIGGLHQAPPGVADVGQMAESADVAPLAEQNMTSTGALTAWRLRANPRAIPRAHTKETQGSLYRFSK